MRQGNERYSKDQFWGYASGKTTLDVKCFCGKLCTTRDAYEKHMKAKHPSIVRKMKKSGEWQQNQIEHWKGEEWK